MHYFYAERSLCAVSTSYLFTRIIGRESNVRGANGISSVKSSWRTRTTCVCASQYVCMCVCKYVWYIVIHTEHARCYPEYIYAHTRIVIALRSPSEHTHHIIHTYTHIRVFAPGLTQSTPLLFGTN